MRGDTSGTAGVCLKHNGIKYIYIIPIHAFEPGITLVVKIR